MKAGRRWTSEAGIDEWSRDRPLACEGMHAVRPQYSPSMSELPESGLNVLLI